MNLKRYLCTYEALYLNSLTISANFTIFHNIYGDTFSVWGDRSELEFTIVRPIEYGTGFFKFTENMGYKSKIEAYPEHDPLVEVFL